MSWTYDTSQLSTSALMQVRFLVQDTDTTDKLVEDEEILFALSENGNEIYLTAAMLCESIALKLGRNFDVSEGAFRSDSNEKYQHYKELAEKYKEKSTTQGGAIEIFAGGISESEKESYRLDDDLVQPFFRRNTHRYSGSDNSFEEEC